MVQKITRLWAEAKRSPYKTFGERWQVFKVLFSLSLKSKTNKSVNKEVSHKIFGYTVTAYDYKTLIYLFREVFLSHEYFFESANKTPRILDCGANIGMAILFLKQLYPDCSIEAFEPNPSAFHLLKKNVEQNKLKNVKLNNIGLSTGSGVIKFYFNGDKGSLLGSINPERGGDQEIEIKTETLSSFMKDNRFDMVKIDVEGAEWEILKDIVDNEVITNADRYIIEYHHKINNENSKFSEFLTPFEQNQFGYNLHTTFDKAGDFQDVIVNVYKE